LMNRLVQQCVKSSLLLAGMVQPQRQSGCTYLIYHSVDGGLPIELDLPPAVLKRQLEHLARTSQVLHYDKALARLQQGAPWLSKAFVLTFDDGYRSFFTSVYPMLLHLQLPAILFVTTGFVEDRIAYPMLSNPKLAAEPVTWEMLGIMAESGLVTLGAHTHTHPVLSDVPVGQIEEELAKPIALFQQRLGITPHHFSYPRAIWCPDIEHLVARYYKSAVIGGGEQATSSRFNPYRIPRLPIRRSDGWKYFQAKVHGQMANEEKLYAWARRFRGR
jgi:hypothetical protein